MAVKLYLADGSTTDIVCVTTPVFVVRTPEDFLELMLARKPDPETGQPDMERLGAFLGAHPESMPAIQHTLGNPPPVSYLTCAYNSLHAYRFTNAGRGAALHPLSLGAGRRRGERRRGGRVLARARLPSGRPARAPRTGSRRLHAHGSDRCRGRPHRRLDGRLAGRPRARTLGTLEVTGIATDRERDGDILVFDPTRVTEGIECSDDPILHFRAHAYDESVFRRTGVRRG